MSPSHFLLSASFISFIYRLFYFLFLSLTLSLFFIGYSIFIIRQCIHYLFIPLVSPFIYFSSFFYCRFLWLCLSFSLSLSALINRLFLLSSLFVSLFIVFSQFSPIMFMFPNCSTLLSIIATYQSIYLQFLSLIPFNRYCYHLSISLSFSPNSRQLYLSFPYPYFPSSSFIHLFIIFSQFSSVMFIFPLFSSLFQYHHLSISLSFSLYSRLLYLSFPLSSSFFCIYFHLSIYLSFSPNPRQLCLSFPFPAPSTPARAISRQNLRMQWTRSDANDAASAIFTIITTSFYDTYTNGRRLTLARTWVFLLLEARGPRVYEQILYGYDGGCLSDHYKIIMMGRK